MSNKMTNCKTCGAAVAETAKVCPGCGAKNKKPFYKRMWVWIFAVLVVIIIIAASGSDSEPAPSAPQSTQETQTTQETTPSSTNSGPAESYKMISENAAEPFVIRDAAMQFINSHTDFFPGNDSNKGAISDLVDIELTYGHLTKNISKYGDKLIEVYGTVIDIEETDDSSITYVHISDYEDNSYILYYLGSLDSVFEDSYVMAYALPLDIITFENMGGAYTEAVTCAACYIAESY